MRVTTKVALVILRLVIGWHFLFEGVHKIHTWHVDVSENNKPFSSEVYFRESSGPLGPEMRGKIPNPDEDALGRLTPPRDAHATLDQFVPGVVAKEWDAYPEQLNNLYDLNDQQKKQITETVKKKKAELGFWLTADRAKLAFPTVPKFGFLDFLVHETLAHGNTVAALKIYKKPFGSEKVEEPMTTPERLAYYRALLKEREDLNRSDALKKPVDKDQLSRLRADITAIRTDLLADLDKFTTSLKDELAAEIRRPLTKFSFYGEGNRPEPVLALLISDPTATLDSVLQRFDAYHGLFVTTYRLDDKQKAQARNHLDHVKEEMRQWLASEQFKQQVAHYQKSVADNPKNLPVYLASKLAPHASGQQFLVLINNQTTGPANAFLVPINSEISMVENPYTVTKDASQVLIAGYDAHPNELKSLLASLLESPKTKAYPPDPPKAKREIDTIDLVTMWTLTIVGACLLLGLLCRPAGLVAMVFLVLTYLTYPPWPWLPTPPNTEGNPLYVNKNVVEFAALLVLLTVPSGRWFGLDTLIYRLFRRTARPESDKRTTPEGVNGHRLLSESLRIHTNR